MREQRRIYCFAIGKSVVLLHDMNIYMNTSGLVRASQIALLARVVYRTIVLDLEAHGKPEPVLRTFGMRER